MTNPSPSHTFRVRHCAYMRYFSSPSPPETCLPCLNIYAISSRCHVFTLIFRVSYTSNNEIQCIHKTERGRAGERERVEGEKRLNRQYLPQLENVGDILSPKSIWLGECFIWKGRLSGRTWCYELLKVQREGNYSVVGNATYVCVRACYCMLMNMFVRMWLLAWRKRVRTVQSDDEWCIPFHFH